LGGHPFDGYIDESKLPAIIDGPGDAMLTRTNAARFSPHERY
jgi:hypothetical protein